MGTLVGLKPVLSWIYTKTQQGARGGPVGRSVVLFENKAGSEIWYWEWLCHPLPSHPSRIDKCVAHGLCAHIGITSAKPNKHADKQKGKNLSKAKYTLNVMTAVIRLY